MMISVFKAYIDGIKEVWQEKKLIFLLYGIQVILAYLITLPVSSMLNKAFSTSTMGQQILHQFDLSAFSIFYNNYLKDIDIIRLVVTYGILYLLISTFLAGGIIWLFVTKTRFTIGEFFNRCVQYFARFLRLFLVSLLYIITALIIFSSVGNLFELFTEDSLTEVLPFTLFIVRVVILIILLFIVNMIFDYAKIIIVSHDKHSMLSVSFDSVKFILMNALQSTGLYAMYLLTGILLFVIYLIIENAFVVQSIFGVIVFAILTQVYVFLRQWLRLSFFSGQTIFFQHTTTAMPGMLNKEMLEMAVESYEKRAKLEDRNMDESTS